jgi:uncharacterized membrane protein YfcA
MTVFGTLPSRFLLLIAAAWLIRRLPEKRMRGFVVVVYLALTAWMFVRQA